MDSLESLFSLRGHVGLVTGASSGLGVECVHALAIGGADVVLVARRADRIEAVAADIAKRYSVRTFPIQADVTVDSELDRLLERARTELGEVDILINNAGIAPTGRAENMTRESWEAAIATNVTAPMMLSQRFARRLVEIKKPGRIINMCSIYSFVASSVFRQAAYAATKSALANLTRQLAVEWARYGILVNALAPGWMPTEATAGGIEKSHEKMERFTPMGRLGKPEEIRGTVILLASPAASYMTATIVSVDGGYVAW